MAKGTGIKIPFYLGLDEAFEDGLARVNPLMHKLQASMSKYNLTTKIDLGSKGVMSVGRIIKDTTIGTKELNAALKQVSDKWEKLAIKAQQFQANGKMLNEREIATLQRLSIEYSALYEKKNGKQKSVNAAMKEGIALQQKSATASSLAMQKQAADLAKVNAGLQLQNSYLGRVLIRMAAYSSVFALAGMIRKVRDVTAEFELQRVALGAIIQDVTRANAMFESIKRAAVKSPFEVKDLVSYTKQLSAYQIETDKLYDTMMRLADISAGLGVDMQRLILAYGQVKAASVLRGQELRQFTEAGIPIVQALADKFSELYNRTVKTSEVFELISKRAVSFEMVRDVLNEMTDAGGIFYEMQEKQAETLKGKWTNLKDAISIMYDEIGRAPAVNDAMKSTISAISSMAKNWRDMVRIAKVGVATLLAYKAVSKVIAIQGRNTAAANNTLLHTEIALNVERRNSTIAVKRLSTSLLGEARSATVTSKYIQLLAAAELQAKTATNLVTVAMANLKIAFLSNPVGLIVTLFATLASVLLTIPSRIDRVRESFNEFMDDFSRDETNFENKISFNETAVQAFIRIRKKLDSAPVDSPEFQKSFNSLTQYVNALNKYYPEIVEQYDLYNASVEDVVSALNQQIDAQNKLRSEGYDKEINALDEEIQKLKDEKNLIEANKENRNEFASQGYGISFRTFKKVIKELDQIIDDAEAKKMEILQKKMSLESGDEADQKLTEWQKKFISFSKSVNGSKIQIYDSGIVQQFTSLSEGLDDAAKKYKEFSEDVTKYEKAYEEVSKEGTQEQISEVERYLDEAKAKKDMAKELLDFFNAFFLTLKKSGSSKSAADMYAELLKDQSKFIQDFEKNLDDLSKFMNRSEALEVIRGNMRGRGNAIGIDVDTLFGTPTEWGNKLKSLIDDTMTKIDSFKEAKGKSIVEVMGMKTKNTELKKYINTLTQLWEQYTNNASNYWEKAAKNYLDYMNKVIEKTKTASEFYKNILDITGDKDISAQLAVSVYGDDGKKLKESIAAQINAAFKEISVSNATVQEELDELRETLAKLGEGFDDASLKNLVKRLVDDEDWSTLQKLLYALPKDARSVAESVITQQQKSSADWVTTLMKEYAKTKTYEKQITDIRNKEAQKRVEIDEWERKELQKIDALNISDAEKAKKKKSISQLANQYRESSSKKERESVAAVKLEELKNTKDWERAFGDLDRVGKHSLESIIALIDELIAKQKEANYELSDEMIKSLTQAKTQLVKQKESRNAYSTFIAGASNYTQANKKIIAIRKSLKRLTVGSDEYNKKLEELKNSEDQQREGLDQMIDATNNANAEFELFGSMLSSVQTIFQEVGGDDSSDFAAALEGIGSALTIVGAGLAFINAILTLMESNPIVLAISAIVAGIAAVFTAMSSVRVARATREIKAQQRALDNLTNSYERLTDAQEKAFGNDYITNYEQQLQILKSKAIAYMAQANAERKKEKKADDDVIAEYEQSYRDTMQEIEDMQSQLSEHFAGSTLADAAKNFAESWIEAYKEFASTTDAMSEKFNEFVENMIVESIAAKIIQTILQPLFDEIDELAKTDGELSAIDIAKIASESEEYVNLINTSLSSLMNDLASAGYNIRQSSNGLTGISKDIASASEESILGLAAGINTQNFYISQIHAMMQQIVTIMSGGGTATTTAARTMNGAISTASTTDDYLSSLPKIADNTANAVKECQNIANELKKVIVPKSSGGNGYKVLIS